MKIRVLTALAAVLATACTASAATVTGQLINVDIQSSGNPTMSGGIPEGAATGATGDSWNIYNVVAFAGAPAVGPVLPLVDSGSGATTATFQITDPVNAVCCAPASTALTTDGSLLHGSVAPSSHAWEILGLTPGGTYEMHMYSLNVAGRSLDMDVDLDGDGVIAGAGELATNVPGSNAPVLFPSITADATGRIFGVWRLGAGAAEGNAAGFQLRDISPIPAPEPSTLILTLCGLLGLACGRRRRHRS